MEVLVGRVSRYLEEFRRNAVALVVDGGRPMRKVADELGLNHAALSEHETAYA